MTSTKEYFEIVTSKIIKESGNADDKYNMGKMIFQGLKDYPDFLLQVDAGTGETEKNASVLERSIRCALSFQKYGVKSGDIVILMGPNHIHQCIPLYAAMYLGIGIYGIDRFLRTNELKNTFEIATPKMVFCNTEKAKEVKEALQLLNFDTQIVTYDNDDNFIRFDDFLNVTDETAIQNFKPLDFKPETIALLIATSGSTGLPKCTICTHKEYVIGAAYWYPGVTKYPQPVERSMMVSPVQWVTALNMYIMSAILRITRIQTSLASTRENIYHMINTYKPTYTVMSPTFMATLVNPAESHKCDFSSLEIIILGGSAVSNQLLKNIQKLSPNTKVYPIYGLSEIAGPCAYPVLEPLGSIGKLVETVEMRLINTTTGEDILEPHTPGESWIRGPSLFQGYYNNEKVTKESFHDGWFKTGDVLYKDEEGNLYFVERLKLLLKYRNNQISPAEIEEVIRTHPGVQDTAVTGIPHDEHGELPVAYVVKKKGYNVSSEEIKDLVKDSLADSKQLRGGVIFIDELPLTSGGKLDIQKIKQMAAKLKGEF